MPQHAQFQTTKDLFTALKEKGVEWQPETNLYFSDEFTTVASGMVIPQALPALNALHLLELVQLVFGGVENAELKQYKSSGELVVMPGMDEMEAMSDDDNYSGYCQAAREFLPQTQAAVLVRRYFESGKVLSDLEGCFLDLIVEIKKLNYENN